MEIRRFEDDDQQATIELWERCELLRPWNDPIHDIARKRSVDPDGFLVGTIDSMVIASVMAGYDGHRGWINYLAVDPSHQRSGYGQAIVAAAENRLQSLGCPKVNLQIRDDNAAAKSFYEQIGFREDRVVSYGKRLIADD